VSEDRKKIKKKGVKKKNTHFFSDSNEEIGKGRGGGPNFSCTMRSRARGKTRDRRKARCIGVSVHLKKSKGGEGSGCRNSVHKCPRHQGGEGAESRFAPAISINREKGTRGGRWSTPGGGKKDVNLHSSGESTEKRRGKKGHSG